MPQKKNPVVMEHLKGKSALVLGNYVTAATAMRTTSFSNTIDGSSISIAGAWATFRECCDCLRLSTVMVEAATPNQTRMLDLAERNFSTATDLADAMVRECGLSFRDAHHVVGGVVRLAMDQNLPANAITSALVDEVAREVVGRSLNMQAAIVATCLDPSKAVQGRRTVGSPAPQEVRRRAAALAEALAAARDRQARRRARLEAANDRLRAAMRQIG